jgi:hypothetical protein
MILSYASNLSALNWALIAEGTDTAPEQFFAGIAYDENEFAFVAKTPQFSDSRLILINKGNGTIMEEFIEGFKFSAAPDIAKVNNLIYLFGHDNRSYVILFSLDFMNKVKKKQFVNTFFRLFTNRHLLIEPTAFSTVIRTRETQ